ncbi:glycosyltransferase family A protein [Algibacter sp. 2305UL17-15]|uniref:glycosyltransferase family 2 protein n=1 Tax=Algibacter sp. 2305UL17-15 TaxID=3231268 RepID=UPI003457EA32
MLAIVIPYYKRAFFNATLQSLKHQTNKNFRVYIGDDASSENPSDVLNNYGEDFSFVYKRFETNLGGTSLVKQWHRCLELVEDEKWVMVLCDDDAIGENCVEEFYNNLKEIEQLSINVIRYATIVIDKHGEQISKIHNHPKIEKSTDFLIRKLKGGSRSSLSEYVFRKNVLDEVKFKELPLAWYSDYLAVLECSYFENIFTINNAIVSFRLSDLNITGNTDDLVIKNEATFQYYYYLLREKGHFFESEQKEQLHYRLEKTFLDNKKNIKFWLKFSKYYWGNFYFKRYLLFLEKILKSIKLIK